MRKLGLLFSVVLMLVSGVVGTASAENKILTITPATAHPNVDPGGVAHGSFQIINPGEGDYPVHIYAAPYSIHNEAYTPDFSPVPGKPDPSKWIAFDTTSADIKANQSLTVNYRVTVPGNTQPGGYYAVAFVETQESKNNQGVVVNERLGEIFYITVNGTVPESGKIAGWSVDFLQKPPLTAALRLENDGGIHYQSAIHLAVSDLFGRTKYSLDTQKEVLPQTIRRIPLTWDKAPPFGLFKVGGTASVLGKTQTLSSKYVLVMSPTVRYVLLGIFALFVILVVSRPLRRKRTANKAAAPTGKSKS